MSRIGWFLGGALSLAAAAFLGGAVFLSRAHGFSARAEPSRLEQWTALQARRAALPVDALTRTNPVPGSPEVLADARAHWADHCAVCHANDGSGDTPMGKGMYPPAPDMREGTQRMTDGQMFYIIENGVRLTGMPAWGGPGTHSQDDSWKLVHFIRHLPRLTAEEKTEMRKLNPKGPDDLKEEDDEAKFLRGEDVNEPVIHPPGHHH